MGADFLRINDIFRKGRKSRWGIDYYSPWDFSSEGKRKRIKRFFESKEIRDFEKDKLYQRFAQLGVSAKDTLTPEQIAEYRTAKALLPPNVMIERCVHYYLNHHKGANADLKKVFADYVDALAIKGLSPHWVKQIKSRLEKFRVFLPEGTGIGDVSPADGRRWMVYLATPPKGQTEPRYNALSRANLRTVIYGAFSWAVKQEIRADNPFDVVEVPKTPRLPPLFYTVPEARALLGTTALHYPAYVRAVALRLFIGMRIAEIRRMHASEINVVRRKIDVPGFRTAGLATPKRVTKSGHRHFVQTAPEVLWDWIEGYPEFRTTSFTNIFPKIHRSAGVKMKRNGFRHSFATYHIALHGNANLTMNILGQEEDSKAFFDHYRGFADKEDAEEYFAMFRAAVLPQPAAVADFPGHTPTTAQGAPAPAGA